MSNSAPTKSGLDRNKFEAVKRIANKAAHDIENVETSEDKEEVIEMARRKFLILFDEDSDEYEEAILILRHTIDPQLLDREIEGIGQDIDQLPEVVKPLFSPEVWSAVANEVEQGFPVLINKAATLEELEEAFRLGSSMIDSEHSGFLWLKKRKRKKKLRANYERKKRELEQGR